MEAKLRKSIYVCNVFVYESSPIHAVGLHSSHNRKIGKNTKGDLNTEGDI